MSFTLLSYGTDRLEIGSDGGHRFAFDVVSSSGIRVIVISDARSGGILPGDGTHMLEHAHAFATLCALDCGLM
jgi:hypothetical protein